VGAADAAHQQTELAVNKQSFVVTALAATLAFQAVAVAAPRYRLVSVTVKDLGTLGGAESIAHDVNNAGFIVGEADTAAGVRHAFISSADALTDIGAAMGGMTQAHGINNFNHVVGVRHVGVESRGFSWIRGAVDFLVDPDWLDGREVNTWPYAVSDAGRVVGNRRIPFAEAQATLWTGPRTLYDFPRPAATARNTFAYDINSSNVVVGYDSSGMGKMKRWQWSPAGVTTLDIPGFCGLESTRKRARGINAAGKIVGHSESCDGTARPHAFEWNGTSTYSLDRGTLPGGTESFAEDINNLDFTTGYANQWVSYPMPFMSGYLEFAYLYHGDLDVRWVALPRPAGVTRYGHCRGHALNERNPNNVITVVGYCDMASGRHAVRWAVVVADALR
jgi:probable HAF family extracellular repeat protein